MEDLGADASALKDTENVKVTAEADGVARISAFGKVVHVVPELRLQYIMGKHGVEKFSFYLYLSLIHI